MKNQKISKWGIYVQIPSAETVFIDLAFFHFYAEKKAYSCDEQKVSCRDVKRELGACHVRGSKSQRQNKYRIYVEARKMVWMSYL